MTRLAAAQAQIFDVAIIGGGIVGCGVARDAARRGLRVVLFEQRDFGSGTTAASTRIVHGGLRYLETADVRLVRMDLRERETLLRIAPHLVRPSEFIVPFHDVGAWQRLRLRVGLALYDALAFGSSLPRHRASRSQAVYYDARLDSPERLCIENLTDAAAHGALAFNYAEVTRAVHDGPAVVGVRVRDSLTGDEAEVRARITINAAGPWFERVARMVTARPRGRVRTTKGIHLVCPPLTEHALVLFSQLDGRLMFAIPRQGLTWLGTTDTDYRGDPAEARATLEDVEYVIDSLRGAFPTLTLDEVLFTTVGVRALVMQGGRTSSVSRMHKVTDEAAGRVPGLVSITGGKITGYRAIAEEATDVVARRLGNRQRCTTATEPLPGGRGGRHTGASSHLYDLYGSRASEVEQLAVAHPELAQPLSPAYPDLAAQVVFAVRHEHCMTLSDFLRRRSLLGATVDQGWGAAPAVTAVMGGELGWSPERQTKEIDAYARDIERTLAFRTHGHGPRRGDRDAGVAGVGRLDA
ncbi:MAG: glycerol-3-phosphate dehydrogenase/oxidase [Acidobacteria bacterium]|nr:glycerol-3-phosphate dehydrogenase/oxidase [Acidobacteriota bacterium]